MERSALTLGVSHGALAQAERQLSGALRLVVFIAMAGAALVAAGHYLLIQPTPFVASVLVSHLCIAALCLYRVRRPVLQPNAWVVVAYVYFATIAALTIIHFEDHENLVQFGILNLTVCFLLADRRYLGVALVYGLICIALSLRSVLHLADWQSVFLVCVMATATGVAVHIFRVKILEEIQETRQALQRESEYRRKAEDLSLLAKRRETLGVMVGGVTHDFNNYMQAISGSIEAASDAETNSAERRRYLETATSATNAAAQLCRTLLDYVKGEKFEPERFDLNEIAAESIQHANFKLMPSVRIHSQLQPFSLTMHGNLSRIRQAVVNLIANAVDAARTRVEIGTFVDTKMGELCVGLSVFDDGPGIAAGAREQIFDPYFTTKSAGSGLGLAAVAATVSAHGGQITVDSSDLGTEFQIILPVYENAAALPPAIVAGSGKDELSTVLSQVNLRGGWKDSTDTIDYLFDAVFDQLPYLIFYKDTQNRHVRVNKAVASLRGTTPEQMQHTPAEQWHPDEAEGYRKDDQEVIDTGTSKLGIRELVEIRPGEKRWYRTDKHPWRSPTGDVIAILVICQPISDPDSTRQRPENLLENQLS